MKRFVVKWLNRLLLKIYKNRYNVTNYITSPDPLTEREIARQTKLSLQKLAYDL